MDGPQGGRAIVHLCGSPLRACFEMTDMNGDQLRSIASVLERAGFSSSLRGDGRARFVYAEHDSRAVELSHDVVGFFVELFEHPAETSVRDSQQDTPEHAAKQAIDGCHEKTWSD